MILSTPQRVPNKVIEVSSNGRTVGFELTNGGSTPSASANKDTMNITITVCECCKRQYRSDCKQYENNEVPSKMELMLIHSACSGITSKWSGEICGNCAKQLLTALKTSLLKEVSSIKKHQKWRDLVTVNNYEHISIPEKVSKSGGTY